MTIAVIRNLSNYENSPKKRFSGLQRTLETHTLEATALASSVWVFIAQLGEHCSANAEATSSNPVEDPKTLFSSYFRNCLNCDSLRWSHYHFSFHVCVHAPADDFRGRFKIILIFGVGTFWGRTGDAFRVEGHFKFSFILRPV